MSSDDMHQTPSRQSMEVDIACAGFGPAMGGFLTTLSREIVREDGSTKLESRVAPGIPLQVVCYERADDIGFGVSGVVSKARAIRASFPGLKAESIPMAAPVKKEKLVYLLDPIRVSRRSGLLKAADQIIYASKWMLPYRDYAIELPFTPPFLDKHDGLMFSIGQFNQWVGSQVLGSGVVQIWPGMPVEEPLIEADRVVGLRLVDQGVDRSGRPVDGYMPGMDIRAQLTVVGDGPVGSVGIKLDDKFGLPDGANREEWAVGMKMVVDLPPDSSLEPGTVIHTFGFPEPEIFGFMYVHPGNVASLGIFVPSWFDSPVRSTYRFLQHWIQHPYLWHFLKGGVLRSWGAKTLQESGRRGEPFLVGHGFARIGEGSGSTNILSGSGVDEAWMTGVLLAEAVIELVKKDEPFTKEMLEAKYVKRRRASWLEKEAHIAAKSRDGFHRGFVSGMIGMMIAWLSRGKLSIGSEPIAVHEHVRTLEEFCEGRISPDEVKKMRLECGKKGVPLHDAIMDRLGWPPIEFDGKLLISHQDALLMGGKVQAIANFKDHVTFRYPALCSSCTDKICIEMCSGQAITRGPDGRPVFDREKCVHCGACLWNCVKPIPEDAKKRNIRFQAGSGGLHSAEN